MKTVAGLMKEDGHLEAAATSITGSGGRDLQIETTALAVLGWLKANRPAEFTLAVQRAVRWIGQQRGGFWRQSFAGKPLRIIQGVFADHPVEILH